MASARGLITLTSSLLSSAASVHRCTPCNLRASICPLVNQIRHRNKKKTRFRAPPEPKHKEKWNKTSTRQKFVNTVKAVSTHGEVFLTRVPTDDVWIRAHYPRPRYTLEECLEKHREFADPSMLDTMDGFVYADMELDMKTNKKTKFLSNIRGTILLPYQFEQSLDQKIAIFCKKDEDLEKAMNLGASYAGDAELVQEMLDGQVDKNDIDVVLCTPDVVTELIPIRSHLRDKFPSKARGSVGSDIEEMWTLFTKGVTYSSLKESDAVAKLQVPLGQVNMPSDQLAANFKAYIEDICKGRPRKSVGPLITQIYVIAPPSTERFLLQIENYVPGYEKAEAKADDDSDSDQEDAV